MAAVRFVQNGPSVTYIPTVDVFAGDVVVQSKLVGVARQDIRANTQGALWHEGIFDFPKSTAAGSAFSPGDQVYWDAANKIGSPTASGNELIGKAIHKAEDADLFVRVKLNQ